MPRNIRHPHRPRSATPIEPRRSSPIEPIEPTTIEPSSRPATPIDLESIARQREAWVLLDAALSALDPEGLRALRDVLALGRDRSSQRDEGRRWIAMLDGQLASLALDPAGLEYLAAYAATARASHLHTSQAQYLEVARAMLDGQLASLAPGEADRVGSLAGIVGIAGEQARDSARSLAHAVRKSDRLRGKRTTIEPGGGGL